MDGRAVEPLIDPCKCEEGNGRYHYSCLVQYIEHNLDKPCTICKAKYRDRRIRRYITERSFRDFMLAQVYGPAVDEVAPGSIWGGLVGSVVLLLGVVSAYTADARFGFAKYLIMLVSGYFAFLLAVLLFDDYESYISANNRSIIRFRGIMGVPNNERIFDVTAATLMAGQQKINQQQVEIVQQLDQELDQQELEE